MKLLALLILVAAPEPPANKFDLVCSGTLKTQAFEQGEKSQPYSYTYRIDLDDNKWCSGGCGAIKPIHEAQPSFLRLEPPRDEDTVTKRDFFLSTINRETGHHSALSGTGRGRNILMLKWEGECVKHPFSGFSSPPTKF